MLRVATQALALAGLLLAAAAPAADPAPPAPAPGPAVTVPAALTARANAPLVISAKTSAPFLHWVLTDDSAGASAQKVCYPSDDGLSCCCVHGSNAVILPIGRKRCVFFGAEGRYKLLAVVGHGAGIVDDPAVCVITVGTPPVPPGPVPPGPTPPPGPAPIPAAGFRVLMLYESAELSKYPYAQQLALTSATVRQYLNAHCVKGEDGKTPDWRVWDKDTDAAADSQVWRDALKRGFKSLPWIVISDGKAGFEGPLPADVASTLALLQKYGGQ